MTDSLTKLLNKKVKITTSVGNSAWHYTGKVLEVTKTHILLIDEREGKMLIPISDALIREVQ